MGRVMRYSRDRKYEDQVEKQLDERCSLVLGGCHGMSHDGGRYGPQTGLQGFGVGWPQAYDSVVETDFVQERLEAVAIQALPPLIDVHVRNTPCLVVQRPPQPPERSVVVAECVMG